MLYAIVSRPSRATNPLFAARATWLHIAILFSLALAVPLTASDAWIGLENAMSSGGSRVDTHELNLVHVADDYRVGEASGCRSCGGGGTDDVGPLPTFHLQRIHRYADVDRPSSLGPGVFVNYDLTLSCGLENGVVIVSYFDPLANAAVTLTDADRDGVFTDDDHGSVGSLRFFDSGHQQVADHLHAATAEIRAHSGDISVFELIRTTPDVDSTDREGRFAQARDRNGNAITVTHRYAADADDNTLAGDRSRLWMIATITDAHDATASFAYRESPHAGRWVVSGVALPNGTHLEYVYDVDPLVGVTYVKHPDGNITTLTIGSDNETQNVTVTFDDAAARGLHRRETALYTRVGWFDRMSGAFTSQPLTRLRRLLDGQRDVMYSNVITSDPVANTVTVIEYLGGASLTYVTDAMTGLQLRRETTLPGQLTLSVLSAYDTVDAHGRPTTVRDALGRITLQDRDPITGTITQTTLPDRTTENTSYNEFNEPLTSVDRLGRRTVWRYDDHGNLLERTEAVGTIDAATWSWAYNEPGSNARPGQPSSATDANGNVTRYVYDAHGWLQDLIEPKDSAADAENPTRHYHHDAAGRLDQSQDEAGRTTTFAYDACNRLVLTTYGDGSSDAIGYGTSAATTANLVTWRRDRNGHHTVYAYDAAGRAVTTRSGLTLRDGRVSSDVLADYIDVPSASVTIVDFFPGADYPISTTTDGETTDFAYDALRHEVGRTRRDSYGQQIQEETIYDTANRVDHRAMTIGPYSWSTLYVYDALDRVVRTIRETASNSTGSMTTTAARVAATRIMTPNPAYLIDDQLYDVDARSVGYEPMPEVAAHVAEIRIATDPRGIRHLRAYDHQGRLVEQVDAFGTANATRTAHAYDAQGNRVRTWSPRHVTEAGGFTTAYAFSGRNLPTMVREAEGRAEESTTITTYTPTGKPDTVTVAAGTDDAATTISTYGECCDRLQQLQDAEGFITTYRYDPVGNVTSITDPLGHTTQTTYDARNRVASRTDAAGHVSTFEYDDNLRDGVGLEARYPRLVEGVAVPNGADGSAVAITDADGATSLAIVDVFGRVAKRIDANGKATLIRHDVPTSGMTIATQITDPLGNVVAILTDGQHRRIATVDATGLTTQVRVDGNGNRVGITDPNGNVTTWSYDERDRPSSSTDAEGATTATGYDAAGNAIWTQDGLGKRTTARFDGRNRRVASTDRNLATTLYAYDHRNNLVSLQDAEQQVTSYQYDRRNLLIAESFPPPTGGTRRYSYDGAGRLIQRADQTGAVTAYEYDQTNLLRVRRGGDGFDDTFAYDRVGRLTQAVSGHYGTAVDRTYDAGGRLTTETQTIDGIVYAVGHAYDDANRVVRIDYPGGDRVNRTYTYRNQLQQVQFNGVEAAMRTYDNGMRLTTTRFGNGLTETRTYRKNDLVASITTPGVSAQTYTYNAERSLLTAADAATSGENQTLAYDDDQRLTTWSRSDGSSQSWNLSPVGDWTATSVDGVTETRTHSNVHELTAISRGDTTMPLAYDAKGNLTRDQDGADYMWDGENRLASATIRDRDEGITGVAIYVYDALGRRVQKTVWGITTTYLHDGAQVIREFDAPQQLAAAATDDDGDGSGEPVAGAILPKDKVLVRINFQPARTAIPNGYLADKGKAFGARSNGWSYGWDSDRNVQAVVRHQHPFPQYDTFIGMQGGSSGTWQIALPNGTYPVIAVFGDCASTMQTNNVRIAGIEETDPDPASAAAYERGDFDGYAELVTVTDGTLTIQVGDGAIDAKLCFIEIGHNGDLLDQATKDKLAAQVGAATQRTGGTAFPKPQPSPREYAYGSYVDEPVMYAAAGTKYAVIEDRQYSVSALVDGSGNMAERYAYDAYGRRAVLSTAGVALGAQSLVGNTVGYTGREHDSETGLMYFRQRMYSPDLGRFVSRDPMGYVDGANLYGGYFVPNDKDPMGLWNHAGHFYTVYFVAKAAGYSDEKALRLAQWAQYTDQNGNYDAMKLLNVADKTAYDGHNIEVQYYLHSLTGGDSVKLRQYLECLIKNGHLSPEQEGILLHAYGDAYAHSYPGGQWNWSGDGPAPAPWERGRGRGGDTGWSWTPNETQFPPVVGHGEAGHLPDYIATHRDEYAKYVNGLYGLLSSMNPGAKTNPDLLQAIQNVGTSVPDLHNWRFSGISPQNDLEIQSLMAAGAANGAAYTGEYRPERDPLGSFPQDDSATAKSYETWDGGAMTELINKLKNGVSGCCPPK